MEIEDCMRVHILLEKAESELLDQFPGFPVFASIV